MDLLQWTNASGCKQHLENLRTDVDQYKLTHDSLGGSFNAALAIGNNVDPAAKNLTLTIFAKQRRIVVRVWIQMAVEEKVGVAAVENQTEVLAGTSASRCLYHAL
ncbi:hypothetical protein C8R44DRAFT_891288 [Mycena epipterygia]|nr:hypothetical protein C8R44DRAFT_891288 [Mycena epipterygia]